MGISCEEELILVTNLMSFALSDLMYKGTTIFYLPLAQKMQIMLDISKGIHYLHSHPNQIIHRDLKPENILMDQNFNIRIADFGLAQIQQVNPQSAILTNVNGGTMRYVPAEVLKGQDIGPAVDIWAFGCLLNELFSLEKP